MASSAFKGRKAEAVSPIETSLYLQLYIKKKSHFLFSTPPSPPSPLPFPVSMPPKPSYMDAMLPGDSDSDDTASDSPLPAPSPPHATKKAGPPGVTAADLKRHGYKGGPSVLLVPQAKPQENWAWRTDAAKDSADGVGEDRDRGRLREQAERGAERTVARAEAARAELKRVMKIRRREEDAARRKERGWEREAEKRRKGRGSEEREEEPSRGSSAHH